MQYNIRFLFLAMTITSAACTSDSKQELTRQTRIAQRQAKDSTTVNSGQLVQDSMVLQVGKEDFDWATDKINYSIIRHAMQKVDTGTTHFDNAIKSRLRNFDAILDAIPTDHFEQTRVLCSDINNIKKKFTRPLPVDSTIQLLTVSIFNDSTYSKAIYTFYHKRLQPGADSIKLTKMLGDLQNAIKDSLEARVRQKGKTSLPPDVAGQPNANDNKAWLFFTFWILTAAGWISREIMLKKEAKKTKLQIEREHENEIKKLNKDITDLGQTVQQQLNKITEMESITNTKGQINLQKKDTMQQPDELPEPSQPNTLFYFPAPNQNGFFVATQASRQQRVTDVYVIKLQDNSTAHFSLMADNGNVFESAVNMPDSYIYPVCDIDPASVDWKYANRISIVEKGIARKEGDKWIVTTKSIIKLHS
jgi:hypothetical protein